MAVSLVLHALLIFGYRLSAPTTAPDLPPRETMTVWLQPPKPPAPAPVVVKLEPAPVKPVPVRERDKKVEVARASPPAPATAAEAAPTPAQAISAPPVASSVPDPLYPQQQPQPKQFDMNAALKTARKVANEKDPARAGLPVAQLDDHPLYPERTAGELATKMEGAKRKDCLSAPGNLLTPLFWLLERKDHGCKF